MLVTQLCPTLCDSMWHHSLPGSSVHEILQAKILEWVAISFSRGSSWPRDPALAGRFFTTEPPGKPQPPVLAQKTRPLRDLRSDGYRALLTSWGWWQDKGKWLSWKDMRTFLCVYLGGGHKSIGVFMLSHGWLFVTPWTVAWQAPLSSGFCRQEYWSGFLFLSLRDLPDPGIGPASPVAPALVGGFFIELCT